MLGILSAKGVTHSKMRSIDEATHSTWQWYGVGYASFSVPLCPEERHFQKVAPAQVNQSSGVSRVSPVLPGTGRQKVLQPQPLVPLMLGANPLQFLGTSHSYWQTHGTSQSLQPAACLQRAERPQLISHLPQEPGGSHRAAAMLGAPHPASAPLARLLGNAGALLRLPAHHVQTAMGWLLETPREAC